MADIGLGPSFDPFADLAAEDAEKERKVRPDRPSGGGPTGPRLPVYPPFPAPRAQAPALTSALGELRA